VWTDAEGYYCSPVLQLWQLSREASSIDKQFNELDAFAWNRVVQARIVLSATARRICSVRPISQHSKS